MYDKIFLYFYGGEKGMEKNFRKNMNILRIGLRAVLSVAIFFCFYWAQRRFCDG